MPTFVMRVWIPDRPGALGSVASRIGAVRGDLVGIEILERGAGRAIDELMVELPDADLVQLLIEEVGEVDGVDVEAVRPAALALRDARLDALLSAATLIEQTTPGALLEALVREVREDFEADWVCVIDVDAEAEVVSAGDGPAVGWLVAFLRGMGSAQAVAREPGGPDDVAYGHLPGTNLSLVLGRMGRPYRARERRQLTAVARIAGVRLAELSWRHAVRRHPAS